MKSLEQFIAGKLEVKLEKRLAIKLGLLSYTFFIKYINIYI